MIAEVAGRIWWRRFVSREACPWDELERFPCLRPDQRRRTLAERLLSQVQYFGTREDALPEWREAARIKSPDELWSAWPSLPIVTKETLRSRFPAEEMQSRFHIEGIVKSTGGSTGEPTRVLHDEPMMRAGNAASTYTRLRMGWRPGMATIKVWGSERDIGRRTDLRTRLYGHLLRDILFDSYQLTDETVARVLDMIRKCRPVALWGFTSMLNFIATKVLDGKARPAPGSVRTAWNGGEMLFDDQVETFRKAFGVPILNRYGGRELSAMACQFEDGGPLAALRPWLFLEVVNDSGKPAAPGEQGRLLWTSTVCRGTPLLRYEIGDLGSFLSMHEDESGVSALKEILGRSAGVLELPGGRKINCLYWNHLFKEVSEVRQFQVVLHRDSALELLLKGAGFTPPREAELRRVVSNLIGEIPLTIRWVDDIPLTSHGKLVQVIRR